MAKTAKKAARKIYALIRLAAVALVLILLAPIFTVYRIFVKSNGAGHDRATFENDSDSIFAPLDEVQFIRPVRADIPPH